MSPSATGSSRPPLPIRLDEATATAGHGRTTIALDEATAPVGPGRTTGYSYGRATRVIFLHNAPYFAPSIIPNDAANKVSSKNSNCPIAGEQKTFIFVGSFYRPGKSTPINAVSFRVRSYVVPAPLGNSLEAKSRGPNPLLARASRSPMKQKAAYLA